MIKFFLPIPGNPANSPNQSDMNFDLNGMIDSLSCKGGDIVNPKHSVRSIH